MPLESSPSDQRFPILEENGYRMDPSEKWKNLPQDLLEPQFYPDPVLFRTSLEKMSRDDVELMTNLTSNKAVIRVLAPYLKIMRKKLIESVQRSPRTQKSTKDTKVLFDKKAIDQYIATPLDVSQKAEMVVSIHETADVLKALVRAKTIVCYFINHSRNEIYQSPRHVESSTSNLTWKIEPGTTMAAYAAYSKEFVLTDNVATDERFPLGLGFPGTVIKYALCVPIKTPDKKIIGVYELAREAFDLAFDKKDVQLVLALTGWMGVAILQNFLYTTSVKQMELSNYLFQLTSHYHAGNIDVTKTLSDIIVLARETIGAERCRLNVVLKRSKGSLILEEWDQGFENARLLFKRRMPKRVLNNESPLSKTLFENQVVNEHEEVTDANPSGGFVTRSTLIVPIPHNAEIIGAIKLMNKTSSAKFEKEDIETLEIFASTCAINLSHLKLQEKLKKAELQNSVTQEMLFHHIKPCAHDQEEVKKSVKELPDQFFTLSWYPSPDDMPKLMDMAINMFHEVLGDSFMTLNNVPKFILTVRNCYRPNPYHNFLHAFAVTHAMANIIKRYHKIFTGLERKGLMVAALCHDVDHRGYNNNFLQLTKHYLASLYETSPLENHHFAVTKILMHQCGMFKYFKKPIYNELLLEIYEDIIATDLSLYFQNKLELIRVADQKTFTFKNLDHRRLVKSLMMTACDLSGQTKSLPICSKITEDVYEEFYQQGDVEKKMGYVPLPTMDRDKKDLIPENQVQFLTVVVIPCVETVSRIFSTLSPLVWDTRTLLKQWREMIEVKDTDVWTPGDSVPR